MSFFDNLDFSHTLGAIRDRTGLKFCDVYQLTKSGQNNELVKFLPSPEVDFINLQEQLDSGGTIESGSVLLKQIPVSRYSEDDLKTTTKDDKMRKYWVITTRKGEPKAYTTARIERKPAFWEVTLERYKSLNSAKLTPILEAYNGL